jgi:RimJ/RimL family protein N-acetyltransferase
MTLVTPTLRGDTVLLRALTRDDEQALADAAGESRASYLFSPVPDGLVGTRRYIDKALRQRDEGARLPFVIERHGRVVGTTSYSELTPWEWPEGSPLQRHDRPDAVEVGYTWLAHSAQRTAVNTEAKYLLFRHAFEHWEVHSVSLRTDLRNERSRAAIERVGARFDGVRRAHCPGADGTLRTSAFFSILRAEWPEVRARLEAQLRR